MPPANDLWLLWLLTGLLWLNLSWFIAYHLSQLTSVTQRASSKPRIPKPLTPRSEDDCPDCVQPILRRHPGPRSKTRAAARSRSTPKATRAAMPNAPTA